MEITSAVVALAALAQETRLSVYRMLVEAGPDGLAAGRLADGLSVAPASLSFHLKELLHAGLVHSRQDGRYVIYSANYEAMNALLGYLTENCCRGTTAACLPTACCEPANP
ncbi:metalloregulator ArsR/SmtB family transcription factor [Nevskia sp.]|uniref:ArsR/SmtB family transcription factor n=1 Tax=Nevskia sp. TaxID=1929292 RepID=UPI0025D5DB32|nr:metalloregulator ArsR/SmtB family transcription factor [Nevskia sp.]